MKMLKAVLLILITLPAGILISCNCLMASDSYQESDIKQRNEWLKKYPPSKTGKELSFQYSFPNEALVEKDIFLWDPRQLATDGEGNIYVLDNKLKCIYKFDAKGKYITRGGNKGQGPGEFINPYCFCANDTNIFVGDTSKYDMQIFDHNLIFIKSFKTFKAYIHIAANDDGLIFAVPMRAKRESPLVDVLDDKGKLLNSFGEGMFGNDRNWLIPNWVFVDVAKDNEIYLAFKHFPTVCKYSTDGKFLGRFDIGNRYMKYTQDLNIEGLRKADNRTYTTTIYGLRCSEKGFYILQGYPYIGILEYDKNGNYVKEYWSAGSVGYNIKDFIVDNGYEKRIFILEKEPRGEIKVFGR